MPLRAALVGLAVVSWAVRAVSATPPALDAALAAYARDAAARLEIVKISEFPATGKTDRHRALEQAGIAVGWADPRTNRERFCAWRIRIQLDGEGALRRDMWPAQAWGPVERMAEKLIVAGSGADQRVYEFPGPSSGTAALRQPESPSAVQEYLSRTPFGELGFELDCSPVRVARCLLSGMARAADVREAAGPAPGTTRLTSAQLHAAVVLLSDTGEIQEAMVRTQPGTVLGVLFEGVMPVGPLWPARCPRIVRMATLPDDLPLESALTARPEFDRGWAWVCENVSLTAPGPAADFDWKALAPLLVDARTGKVVARRTPRPPKPEAKPSEPPAAATDTPPPATRGASGPPPANMDVAAAFNAKPARPVESTVAIAGGATLVVAGVLAMYIRRRSA